MTGRAVRQAVLGLVIGLDRGRDKRLGQQRAQRPLSGASVPANGRPRPAGPLGHHTPVLLTQPATYERNPDPQAASLRAAPLPGTPPRSPRSAAVGAAWGCAAAVAQAVLAVEGVVGGPGPDG